jgi:dynactin 1
MGDSKEQAEVIMNLETELARSQEQEGIFERAVEELQAEIEQLQQDNAQLKRAVRRGPGGAPFRSGASTPTFDADSGQDLGSAASVDMLRQSDFADRGSAMPVSNQVEALKALVRYLRLENSRLTAQVALLSGMGGVATSSSSFAPPSDPLARRMAKLGKAAGVAAESETAPKTSSILADIRNTLAAPKVVDLTVLDTKDEENGAPRPAGSRSLVRWIPRKLDPVQQYREQNRQLDKLLNEAKKAASYAAPRKDREGRGRGSAVCVGKLSIPGKLEAVGGGRINLDWQGLESVHRCLLLV